MSRFGNIADLCHDRARSVDGVPLDLGGGRSIRVRRAGGHNRLWSSELARALAAHRDEIAGGALSPELAIELDREVIARACVASWAGFVDDQGGPVACDVDAVLELFEAAPDVYERVRSLALDGEAYRLTPADCKSS